MSAFQLLSILTFFTTFIYIHSLLFFALLFWHRQGERVVKLFAPLIWGFGARWGGEGHSAITILLTAFLSWRTALEPPFASMSVGPGLVQTCLTANCYISRNFHLTGFSLFMPQGFCATERARTSKQENKRKGKKRTGKCTSQGAIFDARLGPRWQNQTTKEARRHQYGSIQKCRERRAETEEFLTSQQAGIQ